MAWTVPMTWLPETFITAADLNRQIRDNLLETEAAKATTAGQLLVSSGSNSVAMRTPVVVSAAGEVTTSSTTPVALSGGPSTSFTHGGSVLLIWGCEMRMDSGTGSATSIMRAGPNVVGVGGGSVSRSVGGAASNIDVTVAYTGHTLMTGMTPGTNTVELNYWRDNVTVFTAAFSNRRLIVIPL